MTTGADVQGTRAWTFHPFLFAAYPVVLLYSINHDATSIGTAALPLVAALPLAALIWAVLAAAFRDRERGALLASLVVILFGVFGHVHLALHELLLAHEFDVGTLPEGELRLSHRLAIGMTFVCLGIIGSSAAGIASLKPRAIAVANRGANTMAAVLLGMSAVGAVIGITRGAPPEAPAERSAVVESYGGLAAKLGYAPDIYVIILDGYGRADMLSEYFRHDNQPFVQGLEARGFHVLSDSRANFNWTVVSLTSTLNMRYVNDLLGDDQEETGRTRAYMAIRDNEVMRRLRGLGYRSVHLQSTWGATMRNPFADEQIPCGDSLIREDFYRLLVDSSFLKVLAPDVGVGLADCHLHNFETLARLGPAPGPKVVLAHFIPPHHPYLFDRKGNVLDDVPISDQEAFQGFMWAQRGKYIDQLVYMNERVQGTVDAILASSPKPPIIVVMSDHGPQLVDDLGRRHRFYNRARYANLVALHLPGVDRSTDPFPEDLTLVNLFRILLDTYFDLKLGVVEDRFYFSEFLTPFQFRPVRGR